MLPRKIPKAPKRSSRWRTSSADGDFCHPVDPESLRELISYSPATGELIWRERHPRFFASERDWKIWNTRYAGKGARTTSRGYRKIRVLGVALFAHRVAWAIHYGEWPTDQIDHVNGDRCDNRISNLRLASNTDNSRNIKRPANNTSGRIGVSFQKNSGRWRAEICVDQKRIHLGSFITFEEACAARTAAEAKYGFHRNHGRAA